MEINNLTKSRQQNDSDQCLLHMCVLDKDCIQVMHGMPRACASREINQECDLKHSNIASWASRFWRP